MKEMSDIGVDRRERNCGQTIRKTMLAVLCFYIFAALLNGEAIMRDAERMRYGTKRDVFVAILKPADWLSRATRGCALRTWLEKSVHRDDPQ